MPNLVVILTLLGTFNLATTCCCGSSMISEIVEGCCGSHACGSSGHTDSDANRSRGMHACYKAGAESFLPNVASSIPGRSDPAPSIVELSDPLPVILAGVAPERTWIGIPSPVPDSPQTECWLL